MDTTAALRPVPVLDADSAPFWEAIRRHEFVLQRCGSCGRHVYYPRAICPHCGADALVWEPHDGGGEIYSFTVVRRAPDPGFEPLVPYVVALIDLADGARMMANVVDVDVTEVRCGQRVEIDYLDVSEEDTIPVFRLAE